LRYDALRAQCIRHLSGTEIPRPFSLEAFAASVAVRRGRALHVLPLPGLDGADGLSGVCVATDDADYVLIDAYARGWHRDVIGLHEIGHILCGHTSALSGPGDLAGLLTRPGPSATSVRRGLCLGDRDTSDEQEAELTGWLILAEVSGSDSGSARQTAADLASIRALHSMWRELAGATPGLAGCLWPYRAAHPARIRLIQRTAEIRDAVLALRSFVSPSIITQSRRLLASAGLTGTALDSATEACWLKLASRAAREGAPAQGPAHVLPCESTLDEEVVWLLQIAEAMRSPRVQFVTNQLILGLWGRVN
jgi:hypothetical protein